MFLVVSTLVIMPLLLHISTNFSKHGAVVFGQTEIWAFLAFVLFHLSLQRKVHQSIWKVVTHGGGTCGTIFHALGMVFRLFGGFWGSFCDETMFSKAFFQYFLNFQFVKYIPITKKWQIQRECVLTNCNHAKSDGTCFQQGLCFITIKAIFWSFSAFLVLVGLLWILTHGTWQLH